MEALLLPVGHIILTNGADSLAGNVILVAAPAHRASSHRIHTKSKTVQDDKLAATVVSLDIKRGIR